MARIILVTGGARSGKSQHALETCLKLPGPRAFLATCQAGDEEMAERIRRHKESRSNEVWTTIEEPLDLSGALQKHHHFQLVLVDCLTLWISNLMGAAEEADQNLDEDAIAERCQQVLSSCAQREGTVLFVTNEVGNGIVPGNAMARRYRDLVGRCNQTIAARADEVTLVTCGIPMPIKKES